MNMAEASMASANKKPHVASEKRKRILAMAPALPLISFIIVFFVVPLSTVFYYAVQDEVISKSLPLTTAALEEWDRASPVPEAAYQAAVTDFRNLDESGNIGALSQRIGIQFVGGRALVEQTIRRLSKSEGEDWKGRLEAANPAWKKTAIWEVISDGNGSTSLIYFRWAVDKLSQIDSSGKVSEQKGYAFLDMFARTATISLGVTLLTVLLGYPLAYVLVESRGKLGAILLLLVLVPFWTSLLVRSMSWVVLLQSNGVVNLLIQYLGLSQESIQLLYTRFATVIAMTQIQLPFTILPMYSVMKTIPRTHVRAARSLGAGPLRAHASVYLPQALPGVAAGALLTFILCLGYYITPALVGGPSDQMASYYIARFVNEELNWGLASALSVMLTVVAVIISIPLCRQIMNRNGGRI